MCWSLSLGTLLILRRGLAFAFARNQGALRIRSPQTKLSLGVKGPVPQPCFNPSVNGATPPPHLSGLSS